MAEIRQTEDGSFEVRLAGSNRWKAVSPEEAEAYGMSRPERMLHSAERGAESLIRGGVSVLDRYLPDMRGPMAPESREDNAARLEELQRQSEAMGHVDPRAGLTAYAPEIGGAFVPGGLPAAMATEAGIGAARMPDNPLLGAAVGAGATALGVPVGRVVGAGARKGLDIASSVIDTVTERAGIRAAREAAGTSAERIAARRAGIDDSIGAARNPNAPPPQRPLEGFLTSEEAEAVGIPLTRGDRMALDAPDRELFDIAAERRSREELQRSSELADAIFTRIDATRQEQQGWLTSRVAQKLGDPNATNLTPAARERIRGDVQDVFKEYFDDAPNKATLQDLTSHDIQKLVEQSEIATPNARPQIDRELEDIFTVRNERPGLSDERQQNFLAEKRSELSEKAEKAFAAGNYELGSSLSQVREVIEDVLERKLGEPGSPARKAVAQARERWRVLKALERANAVDPAGDLNVRSFLRAYQAVTPRYKRLTRGSRGDFEQELETVNWLTTKVQPDSGTAQRLMGMLMQPRAIGGGAAAAGAYGAGNWLFGD